MAEGFQGFSDGALTFLLRLEKNNQREWFDPRKAEYDSLLREPMLQLVEALNQRLRKVAVDYVTEPKRAVMRIYRDVRFGKNKLPYKTNVAAIFHPGRLPKSQAAGLYCSVSPAGVDVAGGMYLPGPEQLLAVRQAIVSHRLRFTRLSSGAKLVRLMGELQGDSLQRMPKGFESVTNDAVRRKQFYFSTQLPATAAMSPRLVHEIEQRFEAVLPFVQFLNQAALAAMRGEAGEPDGDRPIRPVPMF